MTTINNTSSATSSTASTPSTLSSASLSNRFMDLLVAQLKNQDPLNPTDGQQMTSQLAQMQSLSQLEKISSLLQANSSGASGLAQLSQAASAIGKTAMVGLTDSGAVGQGVSSIHYDFNGDIPFNAKLIATDPSTGQQLGSWPLTAGSGDVNTGALPTGTLLNVSATYSNGQPDTQHSGYDMLTQRITVKQTTLINGQVYVNNGQGTQLPWANVQGLSGSL